MKTEIIKNILFKEMTMNSPGLHQGTCTTPLNKPVLPGFSSTNQISAKKKYIHQPIYKRCSKLTERPCLSV